MYSFLYKFVLLPVLQCLVLVSMLRRGHAKVITFFAPRIMSQVNQHMKQCWIFDSSQLKKIDKSKLFKEAILKKEPARLADSPLLPAGSNASALEPAKTSQEKYLTT